LCCVLFEYDRCPRDTTSTFTPGRGHLTCWSTNYDVYASSTSLSSGWTSFANFAPVGTETYNTQVETIIPVQGSSGTTYIYAGDRWTTSHLGGPR
jgi:hypothetical protein